MMNDVEQLLMDSQARANSETEVAARLDFDEAFAIHHRVVFRYACALTWDLSLAEDVVQEVFLRLYQNLDEAQGGGFLQAWLLRVTANVSRNALRGRNRAQKRDGFFVARQEYESDRPEDDLLRQSEIDETRRALAKLKEPLRSCLLLKHEGLSYREIASVLKIKEGNVGSLIARARNEFVRVYGKIGKL